MKIFPKVPWPSKPKLNFPTDVGKTINDFVNNWFPWWFYLNPLTDL